MHQLADPARCTVAELDLASLHSVERFVSAVPALGIPPMQAIVCNAGIQLTTNVPEFTGDGIEMTFAVNDLGHFALVTGMLAELLKPARILVVALGRALDLWETSEQLLREHVGSNEPQPG